MSLSKFLIVATLALLLLPVNAYSEERKVYVDSVGQRLLSSPHGSAMATLNQNVHVSVIEDKDEWVKVKLEGWVRRGALTSKSRKVKRSNKPVVLKSFEITKEPSKEGDMQAWLKLTVKNNTKRTIKSWNSILIVRRKGAEVLFTTRVRHDDANIAPGKTGSVRYYWDSHEKQYGVLLDNPKASLQLILHKLQAN